MSHVDVLRGIYAAFAAGDLPAFFAACAPDIEWNELKGGVHGGCYRGPQEIVGLFTRVVGLWEYYRVNPRDFLPCGDTVVVLGNYDAKHKATGRTFQSPFIHVWNLRDGKAAWFQTFTDTALQQAATKG